MIFLHFFGLSTYPTVPTIFSPLYIYIYVYFQCIYVLVQYRIRTYVCMYDFLTLMNNIIGNGPLVFKGK